MVSVNVRGRDIGTFVIEAENRIYAEIEVPAGYWLDRGGQFQNLISASKRLQILVPITVLLILLLLYSAFKSIIDALFVFTGVPLALTGGILAIWMRGIPLSISAAVGFIVPSRWRAAPFSRSGCIAVWLFRMCVI